MKKILLLITFLSSLTTAHAQQAGSLDISFNGTGKAFIGQNIDSYFGENRMKLAPNGKIISAGCTIDDYIIVSRLDQNGAVDNTFGVNGIFTSSYISGLYSVYDLIILSDNSIILLAFSQNPAVDYFLLKISSNGAIDTSFQSSGFLYFTSNTIFYRAIELQSNGKIVIGGSVYANGDSDFQVIRLNSDGNYDLSFGNDGVNNDGISRTDFGYNVAGIDLSIDNDGKITLVGYGSSAVNICVAKYNFDGSLDTNFDIDGKLILSQAQLLNVGSPISMAVQSDNKIVICFVSSICCLNTNGTLDTSFDNDGIAFYSVGDFQDVQLQKDDKIVVSLLAKSPAVGTGAARINANGTLDTSFDGDGVQNAIFMPPFTSYNAYSIAVQDDGKIIFGGLMNKQLYVVRLHGVTNFNSNNGKMITQVGTSTDVANAVAIRSNGKIIAGGYAFNAISSSSNNDFALVGYNADGSLDYTFGNNALVKTDINAGSTDEIKAIAIQPDGKIIAVGSTTLSSSDFVVARYLADGSGLDVTFGTNGKIILDFSGSDDVAYAVALQTDGTILVAGGTINGLNVDVAIIKLTSSGVLDSTFDGDGKLVADMGNGYNYLIGVGIAVQLDGKIVVGVYANNLDFSFGIFTAGDFGVIRLNTNGSFDTSFDGDGKVTTSFGTNSIDELRGLVLQPDGKIVVGGNTNFVGGQDDFAMMRFNLDGSLDNTFGSGGKVLADINSNLTDWSTGIALYPSGKIAIAGQAGFGTIGVARFNANGTIDNDFDGDGRITLEIGYGIDQVKAMVLQTDGKIILAGNYANGANDDFALISLPACITNVITLTNPSGNYPNATLPNPQIGKSITATNLVNSPANVTYRTSSSITLNPGFKAENGAVFKTEIVGCSY